MKLTSNLLLFITFLFFLLSLPYEGLAKKVEILDGKILEVNREYNFVIVSLGKEDGIKKGMIFLVYRDKKLLGKVEVEEVFKDMSSCIVLPWFKPEEIKIDDGVLKP